MNGTIRTLSPARFWACIAGFAAFTVICAVIGPMSGSESIDIGRAFDFSDRTPNPARQILFDIRIPRVVLALVAGGALAISGAAMQALLRNPLASPYTLGVASGGTLGAAIALTFGIGSVVLEVTGTVFGAFVMSLLTIALVWGLAYQRGRLTTGLLLLAGVSVNFLFGAMVLLLQYMVDFEQNFALIRWMMGSLDTVGYASVLGVAPVLVVCSIVLFMNARAFNMMALGDESARTGGVDVRRLEITGFVASGLLAGAAVSQVGPIGFIGLIVPHTVRLLVGPDYRLVLPGSLLVGAGFLVLCDLVSRIVIAPAELPPGILTALLGVPFFLSLLRSKARDIAL